MVCPSGKVCYANRALAEQLMYQIMLNQTGVKNTGCKVPVRAYYCKQCDRYHLTSRLSKEQYYKENTV